MNKKAAPSSIFSRLLPKTMLMVVAGAITPQAVLADVFAVETPLSKQIGVQTAIETYFYDEGSTDFYTTKGSGSYATRYAEAVGNINLLRQFLATQSGGQYDLNFTYAQSVIGAGQSYTVGTTVTANNNPILLANNPALAAIYGSFDYRFVMMGDVRHTSTPVDPSYTITNVDASGRGGGASFWADGFGGALVYHEFGHSLGLPHDGAVYQKNTSPGYYYDFATRTYVAAPATVGGNPWTQPIGNLPIGVRTQDGGNIFNRMAAGDPGTYDPLSKGRLGWLKTDHFAKVQNIVPAGQTTTLKMYDASDLRVATKGSGSDLRFGVTQGYQDVAYDATLTRLGEQFDATTGKWRLIKQRLDFYYQGANSHYLDGYGQSSVGQPNGIVVELDGRYIGTLKPGQTIDERTIDQMIALMGYDGDGVGNSTEYFADYLATTHTDPHDPRTFRPTHYQFSFVDADNTDAAGVFANLQIQALKDITLAGAQWDPSGSATDAGGVWTAGAGSWRKLWDNTTAHGWVDGDDAVFGANAGTAGVVALGSNISAESVTFAPVASGNYKITGGAGDYTLTLGAFGVMAHVSAELACKVAFGADQYWSVSDNATLTLSGAVTSNAKNLVKMGQGTLALTGANTWDKEVNVAEGTIVQTATQTFTGAGRLSIDSGATYQVSGGTLVLGGADRVIGADVMDLGDSGAKNNPQFHGTGILRLSSTTASTAAPEVQINRNITIESNVLLDAGTHFINLQNASGTITGDIRGTGGITLYTDSAAGTSRRLILGGRSAADPSVNTFTGDLEIRRGSLHVVGATSLQGNNVLRFNTALGDTGRFYLRGDDRSVRDLSSIGSGTDIIANAYGLLTDGTSDAATLKVTQNNSGIFTGKITDTFNDGGGTGVAGALGLTKLGAATLTLTGANDYTGLTTISAGTLQIGNGGTTGTLGSGAVIDNASLVFNRTDAAGYTVANAISGTGTLTQAGTGTLIQTGADTRTGATFVNTGILRAGAANVFSSGSTYTLANSAAAVLDLAGYNQSVGALSGGGATGGNVTLGAATLTLGANTASYAGVISGTGGLVKTGAGIQSLSGQNTYTGGTTVNGGTLRLDFAAATATSNILNSATALTLGGGTFELQGKNGAVNAQTFTGVTLSANTRSTLKITTNGATTADLRLGDMTVGSGATVDFVGASNSTASGGRFSLKSVIGVTGVSLSTAGKRLGSFATWNGSDWAASTGVSDGAGGYYLQAFTGYADVWNGTNPGPVLIANNAAADVRIRQATLGYTNNTLAAGTTTINSLLMSAAGNAATVDTNGKALVVGGGANASGGIAVAAGAKSLTIGTAPATGGTLTSGASGVSLLTLISNNASSTDGLVVNAAIINGGSGTTALTASGGTGGGTVVLAGINTFSGGVKAVSGVKLQVGNAGTTGTLGSGAVSLDAGTTLTFNRTDAALIAANIISGAGDLIQAGTGKTTLTGANTYSGTTTISGGTLQIGNAGTTGSLGSGAVVNNGVLAFNRTDSFAVTNTISGSGSLTKSGAGILTLTGDNTYAGGTVISGGTLQIGSGGTTGAFGSGAVSGTGTLAFNRSDSIGVSNAIGGGVSLAHNGAATLVLTGANTYTGTTTIASGTLQIGNGGTTGALGSGAVTNNGVLAINRSDAMTITAAIGGTGALRHDGTGTTTLTGANTYSGTTLVNQGTLQIGNGGSLGSGAVTLYGTLSVNRTGTLTLTNSFFGPGDLVQDGAGTTIITGDNKQFTGRAIINAGVLQIGNGGTTGDLSAAQIVNNAMLTFKRSDTVNLFAALSGTGALTQAGTGTLILAAANTFTGGLTVNTGGTVRVTGAGTLGASTSAIVDNGAIIWDRTSSASVDSLISGTGTLTKNNTGTLTLTNAANSLSGGITVNTGLLQASNDTTAGAKSQFGTGLVTVNSGATVRILSGSTSNAMSYANAFALNGANFISQDGVVTYSGAVALTGTNTVNVVYSGKNATFGGVVSGTGDLLKTGDGSLILANNNTYAGTTTVSLGTLQVGNGGTTGTFGNGAVVNNSALAFNRTDSALVVGNAISGTGSLTQAGTGMTTLSGNNTYTGNTTVNAGTLRAGSTSAFGVNSTVALSNTAGVALDLNGFSQTVGSLSGGGGNGGNVTLGSATLTTGGNNASTTYSGVISGTGGLTKTGTGNMTLTRASTYSGSTTVAGGVLTLDFNAAGGAILSSASKLVMNGGTMVFKGRNNATITQAFSSTTIGAGISTLSIVRGTGASNVDVNLGAITQSSGGTINFAGSTGTVAGARFITTSGTDGALLDGGAQWAMVNGADWATVSTVSGIKYIVAYAGSTNITTNGGIIPNTPAADVKITEAGGTGAITLAASPTTSINSLLMTAGSTAATVAVGGKTLVIGQANAGSIAVATGSQSLTVGSSADTSPGVITNGGIVTVGTTSGAKSLTLISNNASAAQGLVINSRIQNNTAGGVVSLVASGGASGGTVILAGDNTYTGTTTIANNGTLQIGNAGTTGSLGSGAVTVGFGSTLAFNRTNTLTQTNAISGAGNVLQSGTGTTILTGNLSYTGTTTVNTGTLQIGSGGATAFAWTGNITDNGTLAFNSSSTITQSGNLSGTGALIQSGSGTTVLTKDNAAFSGATSITGGTLRLGNGGVTGDFGTYAGAIANNGVLAVNHSDAVTIANAITGTGGLAHEGTGTLFLTGANTYTGATTITGATLQIGTGGTTGDLKSASVVNNGVLIINRSDAITVASAISGTGNLTKQGAGILTLSGSNSYSGTTTVSAGSILLKNSLALGNSTLTSAGTVFDSSVASHAFTFGGLSGSGDLVLADNAGSPNAVALSIGANNLDTAHGGKITGAGSLTKIGTGTLTLTGLNSYTGVTTISAGTLQIGNGGDDGTLGSSASVVNNASLVFNHKDGITVAAVISGSGTLTQNGFSSLTLSAANTYTGKTFITRGTIKVGNADALGATGVGSETLVTAGGTLDVNGTAINAAEIIRIAGTGLDANGAALINSGATQINALNNVTLTANATVGGSGRFDIRGGTTPKLDLAGYSLTKIGGNEFRIAGATVTNGNIIVNAGTVSLEGSALLQGTGTVTVNTGGTLGFAGTTGANITRAIVVNTGGILRNLADATMPTGAVNSAINLAGTTATFNGGTQTLVYNGVISGTADVTVQSGTTVFAGANTYTGTTTIASGTLQIGNAGNTGTLGSGPVITNGTLAFNRNDTVTYTGVISGTGGVTQSGTGILVLSGANTYAGLTSVNTGTLKLSNALALQNSTLATTATGSVVFDSSVASKAFTLGGLSGAGNIVLANNAASPAAVALSVGNNNTNTTHTGVISGAGSIVKIGTGTTTLSGTNTYTGLTTVTSGILQLGFGATSALGATGVGSETLVQSGGTLDVNGTTVNTAEIIRIAGTGVNGIGALINTHWYQTGQLNNVTLTADASVGGDRRLNIGGGTTPTLDLAGKTLTKVGVNQFSVTGGTVTNGNIVINNGTFSIESSAQLTGTGTVTVNNGGTLGFYNNGTGANVTRDIVVNTGGTVKNLGVSGAINSAVNLAGTTATFDNGGVTQTYNGVISGGADLTVQGSGTTVLTAATTRTGTTTISAGTLQIAGTGALGSGAVIDNAVLSFNRTDSFAVDNAISGTGTLVKNGAGTLTLSGVSNYTGTTTVAVGTLNLAGSLTSAITVASGASITGAGSTSGALTLTSGSTLLLAGGATTTGLTANGGVTFAGNITLNYTSALVTGTEYTVVNTTGAITGYTAGTITCVSRGFFTQTTNKLTFTAGAGALTDTWNVAGGIWDAQTTASWSNGSDGKFFTGDTVKFTDAVGGTAAAVTLNSTVLPAAIIADNSSVNYTISGTGKISGASTLVKNGTGTFTINTANDYTGGTTVNDGTLKMGNNAAFGTGLVTVNTNGTIDLNAKTLSAVTLAGGKLTTSVANGYVGNITLNGGGSISSTSSIGLLTGSSVSGTGDLTLAGGTVWASGSGTYTLSNTGNFVMTGGQLDTYGHIAFNNGGVVINGGTLNLNGASTITSLSGTGGTVSIGSAVTINQTINGTYSGKLTGSGALTKSGAGVLTLTGNTNNNSGDITISAGTLRLGNSDTSGGLGTGAITANGTLLLDRTDALTVANTITGTGAIVKNGTASLALNAASGFTGAITINGGAFSYTGSLGATALTLNNGASTSVASGTSIAGTVTVNTGSTLAVAGTVGGLVTVNTGSTLSGKGTVSALTLAAGAHLLADTTGKLTVSGNASAAAGVLLDFNGPLVAGTTYTVLSYGGSFTGAASNFLLGVRGTTSVDTLNKQVKVVASAALDLRWTGTTSSAWGINLAGVNNFVRQSDSGADKFFQRDSLLMDDTATHTTATTPDALIVNNLTFNNSTKAYTIDGAGSLNVTGTLTKNGTNVARIALPATISGPVAINAGTLDFATPTTTTVSGAVSGSGILRISGAGATTLSGTNNYTGATQVAGRLVLGSVGALGATSGVSIETGGVLDVNGNAVSTPTVTAAGTLTNGSATQGRIRSVSLSGDTIVDLAANRQLMIGTTTATDGALVLNGRTLTKNGAGTLILDGLTVSGAGDIVVNMGILQILDSDYTVQKATGLTGTGTLRVKTNGTVNFNRWGVNMPVTMAIELAGGTLGSTGFGPNGATIDSAISVTADSFFNFNSGYGNVTFAGVVSGTGALTINGDSGTRTFAGANTYSGDTTVNAGTLLLKNSLALQNSTLTTGRVNFDSTVASRAFTLGGLSGSGNIALVNNAGTPLSIALTVGNNNRDTAHSGVISGLGSMIKSGTGKLTLSGANTFTGGTTVSAGTLITANALALGSGNVSVATGATLQIGDGVNNGVTLGAGATLALGTDATLKLGGTNANIAMNGGAFTLSNGFNLDITGQNFAAGKYTLVTGTGNGNSMGEWIAGTDLLGGKLAEYGYKLALENNNLVLTVTAVPEPSTYGIIGAGSLVAAALVRRRRRKA